MGMKRWWIWVVVLAAVLGGVACVCAAGALLVLREGLPLLPTAPSTTVAQTAFPTQTVPPVVTPSPTPSPTSPPTPTSRPLPTATRTPTATPRPVATPTFSPTATRTSIPSPTPFVCDGLEGLTILSIAPGQRFECTLTEEQINDELAQQPDLPCEGLDVSIGNGEVELACTMGIRVWAAGVVGAEDCRLTVNVVRGTFGFRGIVQAQLDEEMQRVPYDRVCVEQVTVGDGVISISGYGR